MYYTAKNKTKNKTDSKTKKTRSNTYVVAIPSYNRVEQIVTKTLATLQRGKIPAKSIYIFVANKEQHDMYEKNIPKNLYGKIVIGVKGITPQRKYIVKYFKTGTNVVSIDDDVEDVLQLSRDKTKLNSFSVGDLDQFFKTAFKKLKETGLYLWGIYPVKNAYFMHHTVSTDLKFILGTMYGFICRHDADLVPHVAEKEDYETSILYYLKDGGVVRFNDICLKTKFHAPGGLGNDSDRFETNRIAAEKLQKQYPDLVKIRQRKSGMTEIRIGSNKKT